MTPLLSLSLRDLVLLALALGSFIDQCRHALRDIGTDEFLMRSIREQLESQIQQADELLLRVNTARQP